MTPDEREGVCVSSNPNQLVLSCCGWRRRLVGNPKIGGNNRGTTSCRANALGSMEFYAMEKTWRNNRLLLVDLSY